MRISGLFCHWKKKSGTISCGIAWDKWIWLESELPLIWKPQSCISTGLQATEILTRNMAWAAYMRIQIFQNTIFQNRLSIFFKAAEAQNQFAQYQLGKLYLGENEDIPRNIEKALSFLSATPPRYRNYRRMSGRKFNVFAVIFWHDTVLIGRFTPWRKIMIKMPSWKSRKKNYGTTKINYWKSQRAFKPTRRKSRSY